MRRALLIGLLMFGSAGAAEACDSIVGWVGVPLCQAAVSGPVAVPNVVGQANAAAATAILQGEGLDAGAVIARCSAETEDEVVGQDPAPGVNVALASLVDLLVSNGIECPSGRPGVNLRGLGVGL